VIGEVLPAEKFETGMAGVYAQLSPMSWEAAARGIMTTDIVPKALSKVIEIEGHTVTITGIAKGSGMIHPNMATMLGFIATDAALSQALLQQCITDAANQSFNRVTVDGDTSTNDACTLSATGQSTLPEITDAHSAAYAQFSQAVNEITQFLAHAIVRDGEGATKFITVQVEGGKTQKEALDVAFTVAHSPLVKTAFFASDPNWGRILAAAGRAGIDDLDVTKVQVFLGDVCIVRNGGRASYYTEEQGQRVMKAAEITIRILLNRGEQTETVWTCDFSYDYVKINAEYRS
jgi:glutamate N-acetyltransferase/amino-acid N-acetyltransferase